MERGITIRIRELRRSHSLTQEELAEALGLSRQSVNAMEAGRCLPSLPVALQLAAYFNVPLSSIFVIEEKTDLETGEKILQVVPWSSMRELRGLFPDHDQHEHQQISAANVLVEAPAVNITEDVHAVHIYMRLAGFTQEQLQLDVGDDFLEVAAEAVPQPFDRDHNQQVIQREFMTHGFSRTVSLPCVIDPTLARAEMKQGILHVFLPKMRRERPRTTRIAIEETD